MPPLSNAYKLEKTTLSFHERDVRKKECGKEKDKFLLVNVSAVPEYQAMISITSGYRQRLDYKDCLLSIFRLHNETINIWTHLLGFLIFSILILKDTQCPVTPAPSPGFVLTKALSSWQCMEPVSK